MAVDDLIITKKNLSKFSLSSFAENKLIHNLFYLIFSYVCVYVCMCVCLSIGEQIETPTIPPQSKKYLLKIRLRKFV